ncbi:MAG: cytochrome-c oxidase [SAR86 cluster bacterium]|uniref:cytochrome-c oxidase n=1 Tax=SAR86 cluster bacterium TaxID=2030880 RepID=A0A2A4MV74_9GAMM|nr:MAG: cytochrome-c oxidase [SAR86 cluster bacterium]
MALAVVLLLLVIFTFVFHFASPWQFTELAADWGSFDFTMDVTFIVTGIVFLLCNLFLAYCVFKFRKKDGHKAVYEPENHKLEVILSVVTTIGVIAMLAPGLFVWAQFVTVPDDATEYEAIGQQWQWSYRYPGADGQLGTAGTEFVTEDNPFGVNPEDPRGQDDILVSRPNMHLPIGKPVKALLRSNDVLHNYTVTQFRVKMDLVPGLVTSLWYTPTKLGTYDILCEELCGIGHHVMRGSIIIEEQADYDIWLASQPTFAEMNAMRAADANAGQQQYAVCATCHGTEGEGNAAMNGPKLAGQQAWYLERQLGYFKSGVRGAHEEDTYGQMMRPMAMILADDDAIRNVSAYIANLPNPATVSTITGDVDNGRHIYEKNCAACHLDDGTGTWYTDAPVLAGMSDWYFVTQINNFRAGIRGLHREDDYGEQMVSMATAMADDEEVADVAAFLNTLR